MSKLSTDRLNQTAAFAKSCRHSIIAMLKNSQSGHPGGSLGCIDYLSLLYTQIIAQTGEKVVVSNGHISPAVYAVFAALGWIDKEEVIKGFRKIGYPYEGHVTRHVLGVDYGTGPLGTGVSAACGFALSAKRKGLDRRVYALMGDGEAQEGQVYEMMNFAAAEKLSNFIVFMDYNQVQLSAGLHQILPLFDPAAHFKAAGWQVIEVDGHDYTAMWSALEQAKAEKEKPTLLLGKTIMGKGVSFMEAEGKAHQATWHGKAPQPAQADEALAELVLTDEEQALVETLRSSVSYYPKHEKTEALQKLEVNTGTPRLYDKDTVTDCRSAYGQALLDLAEVNKHIIGLTADVGGSVKTALLQNAMPERHYDVGIAEQHMVSLAGGMSVAGDIPFCSTFGAFMTSRAKDQARVNDINQTNVKMVSTHCGLSVGEDGPTHQAIDDMGSMLGLLNTMVIEPADPNHCDRIIRYVASHYGNFYVRMGRAKLQTLTKEDGSVFYDANYVYKYGKSDVLRSGSKLTIVASGPMVHEALAARDASANPEDIEIIIASSLKLIDEVLINSVKKTGRVITVEDHNVHSGLGNQLSSFLLRAGISVQSFEVMGVEEYQLSGTAAELYDAAGISAGHIGKRIASLLS